MLQEIVVRFFQSNRASKIIIFSLSITFMDKYIEVAACNVLTPPTFRWLMIGLQLGPPAGPSHI